MRWFIRNEEWVVELGRRSTALFVTMQIIMLVKSNRESVGGQPLPAPYSNLLNSLAFFALDFVQFVPFNCMYEDGFDHFDNLILCTMVRFTRLPRTLPKRKPKPRTDLQPNLHLNHDLDLVLGAYWRLCGGRALRAELSYRQKERGLRGEHAHALQLCYSNDIPGKPCALMCRTCTSM